eukprot:symbB.v1.2.004670.t1/scaffold230.1/size260421/7
MVATCKFRGPRSSIAASNLAFTPLQPHSARGVASGSGSITLAWDIPKSASCTESDYYRIECDAGQGFEAILNVTKLIQTCTAASLRWNILELLGLDGFLWRDGFPVVAGTSMLKTQKAEVAPNICRRGSSWISRMKMKSWVKEHLSVKQSQLKGVRKERKEDGKVSTTLRVDGGLPGSSQAVLKEHGAGTVICVECCPDYSPVCTDYGDAVWGGLVTLKRRLMCCQRNIANQDRDPPTQAEIQERLMYLVEAIKDPHRERASLVISPDVSPYGLLDMPKYEEIIQLGYNTARVALGQWLADEAPESIREIIRATREEEEVVAKSINEVEYGSRLNYATWRKNATRVARKLPEDE